MEKMLASISIWLFLIIIIVWAFVCCVEEVYKLIAMIKENRK